MKKLTTSLAIILGLTGVNAQTVILQESFTSNPTGYKMYNVDGVVGNCSFMGGTTVPNGWAIAGGLVKGCSENGSNVNVDDWFVTPQMTLSAAGGGVTASFTLNTEWPNHKIEVWASKTFNGTQAGLSAFVKMQTVNNAGAWVDNSYTVNLNSLNLVGGDNFYIAIRNAQKNMGYVFLDNLLVQSVPAKDASMQSYDGEYYSKTTSMAVKGTVFNSGSSNITSFDVKYAVNGGAYQSSNFSGLNIVSGSDYQYTINNVSYTAGKNKLSTVVANVNGTGVDGNAQNDTLVSYIYIVPAPTVVKNVMIEDHSGAWCGNCVRALALGDWLEPNRPKAITIVNHNQDVMEIPDNVIIETELKIAAYPTMTIDRKVITTVGIWPNAPEIALIDNQLLEVTPLEVRVEPTYNTVSRLLTVKVTADFKDEGASGDYRINCYVLEDSVNGGTSAYDQANYSNTAGAGIPFNGLGNPVLGYKHRHVLRKCFAGPWGDAGVIPATVSKGQVFQKTYSMTLPTAWVASRVKLVGLVQRYTGDPLKRFIINAEEVPYNYHSTAVHDIAAKTSLFEIYPNPANNIVTVETPGNTKSQLVIMDCNGRLVKQLTTTSSHTTIDVSNLDKGMYFIQLINGEQKTVKKLLVF